MNSEIIINENELREYRKDHTVIETANYFNVSTKILYKFLNQYNIKEYYVSQHINENEFREHRKCHTVAQTAAYFDMSISIVTRLSRKWNIKHHYTERRLSCPEQLSQEQQEYFLGNMLGDGSLKRLIEGKNQNSQFCINQQIKNKEYIEALYEIYAPFSSHRYESSHRKPSTINGEINSDIEYWNGEYLEGYGMYTACLPVFTNYRLKWYKEPYKIGRNQKVVPRDIKLTWKAAATWACDDGSNVTTISPSNTGKFPYRSFKLCTNCFTKDDVEFLIYRLENDLGVIGNLNFSREEPIIMLHGENQAKFCRGIKSFVPWGCFQYKCTTRNLLPVGERNSHNNMSGIIGVHFDKTHNKWIAKGNRNSIRWRKYFPTKEAAIAARKKWEADNFH